MVCSASDYLLDSKITGVFLSIPLFFLTITDTQERKTNRYTNISCNLLHNVIYGKNIAALVHILIKGFLLVGS